MPPTPRFALVVGLNETAFDTLSTTLATLGVQVRAVDNFFKARQLLHSSTPELLVTDIRLGAYNGLHLVLHARDRLPNCAVIVTTDVADVVLQREADSLDATFVVAPVDAVEWRAAILRTLARRRANESGEVIRPPFERRLGNRRHGRTPVTLERRKAERRSVLTPT